jgi:hypothetical protein
MSGEELHDLIELLDLAELLDIIFFALELDIFFEELLNFCVLLAEDFCCTKELDDDLAELTETVFLLDDERFSTDEEDLILFTAEDSDSAICSAIKSAS